MQMSSVVDLLDISMDTSDVDAGLHSRIDVGVM